jgi:membrane protease YdiL (CAAX protease family)
MVSAKPWKFEAVVRLGIGVFLCMFVGSLVFTALQLEAKSPRTLHLFYVAFGLSLALLAFTLFLLRRPWRLETAVQRLAAVLLCFYAGLIVGAWAQKLAGPSFGPSISQMIIASMSFQGAALLLVARFLREHSLPWSDAFGFRNNWKHALLLGFIVASLFLPIGWGLQVLCAKAMEHLPRLHLKPEEQQAVQTLHLAQTATSRLVLGFITILLAPLAEEVLFRGILYPWIKQIGFPRLALWGTALVFAAIHMNLVSFLPLAFLALALALLYEQTDNLLAPITAHALFNGFNFTLLYIFQESMSKLQ